VETTPISYFPLLKIDISERLVFQLLGYRKKSIVVPEKIAVAVKAELELGRRLLRFKGVYGICDTKYENGDLLLNNRYRITSRKFIERVRECEKICLFAVTAGKLYSDRSSQLLKAGETLKALIADAVGSAAAETCAEIANKHLLEINTGYKLTKRFSPGYGDWKVEDNVNFLRFLEADKIGMTVNEGGLMQPEKSVSAAVGLKTIHKDG